MYREGEHPDADLQAFNTEMYIHLFSRRLKEFEKMEFCKRWDAGYDTVFSINMSKAILLACNENQRVFWQMFMEHKQGILQSSNNFIEYAVSVLFDELFIGENDIFNVLINFNAFIVELIAFAYAQNHEDYVWLSQSIWCNSYEVFFRSRLPRSDEMNMLNQIIQQEATRYDNLDVETRDENGKPIMQDGWLDGVENEFLPCVVGRNDDNERNNRSTGIYVEHHAPGSQNDLSAELGLETSSAQNEASISIIKISGKPENVSEHNETCHDKTFSFSGSFNESEFISRSPSEITTEVTKKVVCTSTASDKSQENLPDCIKKNKLITRASEIFNEALECLLIASNLDASERHACISSERDGTGLTNETNLLYANDVVKTQNDGICLPNEDRIGTGGKLFADILEMVKKIIDFCTVEEMDSVPPEATASPDSVIDQNGNEDVNETEGKLFADILEMMKEITECMDEEMDSLPSVTTSFPDCIIDQNVTSRYSADESDGTDTNESKNNLPVKDKNVDQKILELITNPLREKQTFSTKQNPELDCKRKADNSRKKDSFETVPDVLDRNKNFHTKVEAPFDTKDEIQSVVDNDIIITAFESRSQEMRSLVFDRIRHVSEIQTSNQTISKGNIFQSTRVPPTESSDETMRELNPEKIKRIVSINETKKCKQKDPILSNNREKRTESHDSDNVRQQRLYKCDLPVNRQSPEEADASTIEPNASKSVPKVNYLEDELKASIERYQDKIRLYPECRTSKGLKIPTKGDGFENYSCTKTKQVRETPDLSMSHFACSKTLAAPLYRSPTTNPCISEGSDFVLSDIAEADKSLDQISESKPKGEGTTSVTDGSRPSPKSKGRNNTVKEMANFSNIAKFKCVKSDEGNDVPPGVSGTKESKPNVKSPESGKTYVSRKTYLPPSSNTPPHRSKRTPKHRRSTAVSEVPENSDSGRCLAEITEKQTRDLRKALRLDKDSEIRITDELVRDTKKISRRVKIKSGHRGSKK